MDDDRTSLDAMLHARTIVPRWKSPHSAVEGLHFDKARLRPRARIGDAWIQRLSKRYGQFPSPHLANELYETASLYGLIGDLPNAVLQQAADHRGSTSVRAKPPEIYDGISSQRESNSVEVHEQASRAEIHRLRRILARNSDRPLCWSELARHYLIVAEQGKAIRSMQVALQLAKANRYLYRAATRLFVHVHEPERALSLLHSAAAIRTDPALLAAEIAASSTIKRNSRFIGVAQGLLASDHFTSGQLSELAAAVGTVELINGATKRARQRFHESLVAPTENSLAQAQWATEQDRKIVIPAAAWTTPDSHEALALARRQDRDWATVLRFCAAWLAEEPFSSRAAMMGSFVGFRPEHNAAAEQFASAGLRCDSGHVGLLNNRAVARAYLGRTSEAYSDVREATRHDTGRNSAALLATLGLIAFRSGMPDLGREFYERSIAWLTASKDHTSVARALIYLAREEIRSDPARTASSIELAHRVAKSQYAYRQPEILGMSELVIEEAERAASTERTFPANEAGLPASADDFRHQAALFRTPKNIQSGWTRIPDFSRLI